MRDMWFKYQNDPEEKLLGEEVEQLWKEIPGSRNEFRLGRQGLRMYMNITMLVNMTKLTRRIIEYKPMFQMRLYAEESKTMTMTFNTTNAMYLSSALRLLIEDNTMYSYFSKSDSCGWYVKRGVLEKPVLSNKVFSKELKLDVIPAVDDRRLPGYRFVWTRNNETLAYFLTKGEIITLLQRIDSFVNNTPMYVDMFENEILRERLKEHSNHIDSIQNALFSLCDSVNKLTKEVQVQKANLRNEISVAVNSTITTMFAMIKQLENKQQTTSDVIIPETKTVEIKTQFDGEEEEKDAIILEVEDAAKGLLDAPNALELDELPTVELFTEEEKPILEGVSYFNKNDIIGLGLNSLSVEYQKEDQSEKEYLEENVVDLSSIKEQTKSETDDFAQQVETKFKTPVVDVPDGRNISLDEIYPTCVHPVLSEELTQANTACTHMPEEKFDLIKTYDIDTTIQSLRTLIKNGNHPSMAHAMLDAKLFNKANISGMFINRGRIGLPVSSIVYSASLLATAHELIDNNEAEKVKIATQCGMYILNSKLEEVNVSDDIKQVFEKYFGAITNDLTGKNVPRFTHRLFTLDKMLLRNSYEYSAFDMKLETLTDKERMYLAKALTDIYVLLYFAEEEHMVSNSQTPPHSERYSMVNRLMYMFVRAMLLNIIRCNASDEIKNSILKVLADYESVCVRLGWPLERYRDALVSFFVFNLLMKKYVVGKEDSTPAGSYIGETNIYRGLPCEEILAAIYSKEPRSGV